MDLQLHVQSLIAITQQMGFLAGQQGHIEDTDLAKDLNVLAEATRSQMVIVQQAIDDLVN